MRHPSLGQNTRRAVYRRSRWTGQQPGGAVTRVCLVARSALARVASLGGDTLTSVRRPVLFSSNSVCVMMVMRGGRARSARIASSDPNRLPGPCRGGQSTAPRRAGGPWSSSSVPAGRLSVIEKGHQEGRTERISRSVSPQKIPCTLLAGWVTLPPRNRTDAPRHAPGAPPSRRAPEPAG